MSVDFGPIPIPTSPIQEYWERKFKTPSENVSPAIPLSPQVERGIEEQLTKALNDLKKKQDDAEPPPTNEDGTSRDSLPQRKSSVATGYTAPTSVGLLKRRSLMDSNSELRSPSRRPSR